ncbi:MAG: hypothetical protein Q9164_000632 [Protoblastenia rupestris]
MGLGGPRKRAKISYDPNNTNWSRSSVKIGQRILQAQGWKPGDLLGASNTSFESFRSGASVSTVRVFLKDDTLGLGARRGRTCEKPTTGLIQFQDLLGRLNNKSGLDLEKDQSVRHEVGKARCLGRWGSLRFVSGGLLVGDNLQTLHGQEEAIPTDTNHAAQSEIRGGSDDEITSVQEDTEAKSLAKIHWRAQKSERKVQRQRRREARAISKHQSSVTMLGITKQDPVDGVCRDFSPVEVNIREARLTPDTNAVAPGSLSKGRGRHAVRHRYIQQKKMAVMDTRALNEVSSFYISKSSEL